MQKMNKVGFLLIILLLANLSFAINAYAKAITIADSSRVPFTQAKGFKLFTQNCSICHGRSLEGTKQGPPLLHPFYKESHHGDSAFYRAALKGVRAHHWKFGNMPPVKGITVKKLDAIVPYIRWFQKQNGM